MFPWHCLLGANFALCIKNILPLIFKCIDFLTHCMPCFCTVVWCSTFLHWSTVQFGKLLGADPYGANKALKLIVHKKQNLSLCHCEKTNEEKLKHFKDLKTQHSIRVSALYKQCVQLTLPFNKDSSLSQDYTKAISCRKKLFFKFPTS